MRFADAVEGQPEYSSVMYNGEDLVLQRTLVVTEDQLADVLEEVPWSRLVSLRCDRQKGDKRIISYRWRASSEVDWNPR